MTAFAYDAAGNLTTTTYPSGRIVYDVRDSVGNITSVSMKDNAGSSWVHLAIGATYFPFGPLTGFTYGNGASLSLSYDEDGQLTGINSTRGAGTIQNLTYGYDAAGNITSITDNHDSSRDQTFTYDDLNRLASASGPYGALGFTYDGVGNRLTRTEGGATASYAYSLSANQISTITNGGVVRSFSYLGSGQVSQDVRSPYDTYDFTYNNDGRLSTATDNGASAGTYLYNGLEQRVAATVGSSTTHYVFDRFGHLLSENDAAGNPIREYIWLDDRPLAIVDHSGPSQVVYYIHTDHLNRPQKLTNSSGALVWDAEFYPFGTPYSITGSPSVFLALPGQLYAPETGLYQNWHRDYDASLGRYIQSDPIGLDGGINTYAYAGGSPVGNSDSNGQGPAGAAIGGEIGAWIGGIAGVETGPLDAGIIPVSEAAGSAIGSAIEDALLAKDRCRKTPKQCDIQYERDSEICSNLPSSGARGRCWESAAERLAYCIQSNGEVGSPPLRTR